MIDTKDLITEVGTGWQGAEDALWFSFLFFLSPPLSFSFSSSSSSSSFFFFFLLPPPFSSSCSPRLPFSLFFCPLLSSFLSSSFPQVTAE
jgi:hypothetical protein